ncbi:MAG: VOC family protein [Pseudomonadota bacterium]
MDALSAVVPYLTVKDARAALEFCARAFGAETLMILEDETGVFHARTKIGGGIVMLYEERAGAYRANASPEALGGSPVALRLELGEAARVDETMAKATAAGAQVVVAPTDRAWGRLAEVRDPEGHIWRLAASAAEN